MEAREKVSTVEGGAGVRLDAVDLLRGLVMFIMALDHTRDFFHNAAPLYPPEDLTRTYYLRRRGGAHARKMI